MGRDVRGHERSRTKTPLPQWAERRLPCCLMHLSLSKPLQPPPLCPPFSSSALILPAPAFQPAWPQFPFPVTPNRDISLSGESQYPQCSSCCSWPLLVVSLSFPSIFLSSALFIHPCRSDNKTQAQTSVSILGSITGIHALASEFLPVVPNVCFSPSGMLPFFFIYLSQLGPWS